MEKREGYYDYMTRRLREDTSRMSLIEKDFAGLTESHYKVLKHLKDVTQYNLELIKKMWWSNPVDRTYNDSIEIDSLDGKPFFFVKQEDCFKYVDVHLEGLKQFVRNTFPTANSVERILCAPKIQKEI